MGKKKKKVAIVGSGDDSRLLIDRDEFECWSLNNLYTNFTEKYTRWFELHHIKKVDGVWYRRDSDTFGGRSVDEYIESLKSLDIPIYMHRKIKEIPKSVPFPIVDILARFPRGYFNNSFAWMIAFAIIQDFKEIHIYNLCRADEDISEYLVHKFSTEYMLGVADGAGIKVFVAEDSELLKCKYLYGYQENTNAYGKHVEFIRNRDSGYRKSYIQHVLGFGHI